LSASKVSSIECLAGHFYDKLKFDFDTLQKFRSLAPLLHAVALQTGKDLVASLKEEFIEVKAAKS
jgi:hypothetical protein